MQALSRRAPSRGNTHSLRRKHGDEEAVGAVARRREQQRGDRCRRPRPAARRRRRARHASRHGNVAKPEWFARNAGDLVAILLRQHRAGGVDEPAAGFDQRPAAAQAAACAAPAWRWARLAGCSRHLASGRRRQAPRAGAGGIDEDQVEAVGRARAARPGRRPAAPARCARQPASAARRSGAAAGRPRHRRRSGRCCAWPAAKASVLPPAPAQISSTCSRGPAHAISAAICEPSSCTSYQPRPWPISASTLGWRPAPSGRRQPHAERRQRRRDRRRNAPAPSAPCRDRPSAC